MQGKVRRHNANQRRLFASQLLCDAVRDVIEFRHRGLNFLSGFCGNVAGLINDARDGLVRDTCMVCHIV
ncbi:Uncharacterised protein [Citrobacter freundii]|nr:Uncharacterised protein [Citrobacter freundii]